MIFGLSCLSAVAQVAGVPMLAAKPAPKAVPVETLAPPEKVLHEVNAAVVPPGPEIVLPPRGSEDAMRLQVFLDQKLFGPGVIDGKPGHFTKLAIQNYNQSLGRPRNDSRVLEEAKLQIPSVFATAIVPSLVMNYVDENLPYKRPEQAKRKAMAYRSVGEYMAERYHMAEDFLIELNGSAAVNAAKAGSALKVMNVEPFLIENLKEGKGNKKDPVLSARHVVVDTDIKQVLIYELVIPEQNAEGATMIAKPKLIASFPITPGKVKFIPKGFWNLKNSIELPVWRYDQKLLETGVRGKESLSIPAGPNNPVGVIWNGLTKSGIGLHGTNNPVTIGRARSAGCIRMSNWDAIRFPTLVRPGAVVVVK